MEQIVDLENKIKLLDEQIADVKKKIAEQMLLNKELKEQLDI